MHSTPIERQWKKALRRRGIWGQYAQGLIQAWSEHVADHAARRVEEGMEPAAAEEAAWQSLGAPDDLARVALQERSQGSLTGRHPWLLGISLSFLFWLVCWVMCLVAGAMLCGLFSDGGLAAASPASLAAWKHTANWLPWLLCGLWLIRVATRMPGGWKHFWITAVVLALFSASAVTMVQPALNGPGSGSINVALTGPVGATLMLAASPFVDYYDPAGGALPKGHFWATLAHSIFWVKAGIILGAAAIFRGLMTRSYAT